MTPTISADNISVKYGDHQVIEQFSLAVDQGGFIGILGPNGCGKTTFLRALSRILKPDDGAVFIEGLDAESYDSRALAKTIGCVGQETDVAFPFTVREIVLMGRYPHIGKLAPLSAKDLAIADEAMKTTNTFHLADRLITEVSGGERQRVLIARTLTQQPRILLLDEPTSHLDINHQIEIMDLIRDLTPEITVIGVFHDLNLASYFCDRIVLMKHGKILAVGTPMEVLTPEKIRESFSVGMMVSTHPLTGKPHLIPEYGVQPASTSTRIHVISGGGTGTEILYTLCLHGFTVSAGVLAANDSDCLASVKLGLKTIIEPPFAVVSEMSVQKLKTMLTNADKIVVTGMPIGYGNLANLKALTEVSTSVYLIGEGEDYTDGEATRIRKTLIENGAVVISDITTLMKILYA
ncbi:MAG: ABC transporter ATP-binding protein [Methanocorpusculum sp.]|uniref:ABC transporter ATP-binding protein n=1 Tax=Methanocorpusculum sp. TaxID=2058474 RepID=UPI00271B19F5|nr:ABC transporter ATP-binding protein [Methanocorpusculum sp.]MDO9523412.1 ABC transporter ATP-binding protein [Methanocorpusculum sp.]